MSLPTPTPSGAAARSSSPSSPTREQLRKGWQQAALYLRVLRANPLTFVGFLMVAAIIICAIIMILDPYLLVNYAPDQITTNYNLPPSWQHPMGTDGLGLDIWSETMYALPLDLGIAFAITIGAMVGGGGLGLIAGYWDRPGSIGGAISTVILRITDIFLAFPSLILALAIAVSLGRGVWQLIVAILLTWWPYYVRLVRGETLAVKHLPYVTAAKAAGVTDGRIVLRHVLRNVLEPTIVYFTLDIGTVLVTLSTIGFVGLGVAYPGTAEWGSMISYYQTSGLITTDPWTVLGPGLAIFVTVLAFSLLGDGLRDILDPRSRRVLGGGGVGATPSEEKGPAIETPSPAESEDLPGAPPVPVPTIPGQGVPP